MEVRYGGDSTTFVSLLFSGNTLEALVCHHCSRSQNRVVNVLRGFGCDSEHNIVSLLSVTRQGVGTACEFAIPPLLESFLDPLCPESRLSKPDLR